MNIEGLKSRSIFIPIKLKSKTKYVLFCLNIREPSFKLKIT